MRNEGDGLPDMMGRQMKNKAEKSDFSLSLRIRGKSRITFLRFFVCLFCVLAALSAVWLHSGYHEREAAYSEKQKTAWQRLTETAENTVSAAINACNTVFSQSWYRHFRNHADLYRDTFTVLYRQEVTDSLSGLVLSHPFLRDLAVITPYKDSVISTKGWMTMADYERFYGMIHIEAEDDYTRYPCVSALKDGQCIIVLQDFENRHMKSVLVMIMDRNVLKRQLAACLQDCLGAVWLTYSGRPLLTIRDSSHDFECIQWNSEASQAGICAEWIPFSDSAESTLIRDVLGCFFLTAFGALLLSLLFTRLSMTPLKGILHHVASEKTVRTDPYEAILQCIVDHEHNVSQMITENQSLQAALAEARQAVRELRQRGNGERITEILEEFLSYLKEGDTEKCLSVTEKAQREKSCDPWLFLLLLSTAGIQTDMKVRDLPAEEQWKALINGILQSAAGDSEDPMISEDRNDLAEKVCSYIRENYRNPEISVNLLAEEFQVHRTAISRLCREYTGETYTDFLLTLRIRQAESLLARTAMSMSQIASAVGYENYRSFKRAFLRRKGISPAEYRVHPAGET